MPPITLWPQMIAYVVLFLLLLTPRSGRHQMSAPDEIEKIIRNLPSVNEVFTMAAEAKRDSLGIMEDPELVEILERMRQQQLTDVSRAAEPSESPSPSPQ